MEWSRVKSILICVFAAVNLFLFFTYFKGFDTGVSLNSDVIENTVMVLEKNNVQIDKSIIPKKTEDMRMFDAENKYASPKDFTSSIGNDVKIINDNFEYVNPNTDDNIKNLNKNTAKTYAEKEMKKLNLLGSSMVDVSLKEKDDKFVVCFSPVYDGKKMLDVNLYAEVSKNGIVKIFGQNWLTNSVSDSGITNVKPISEILINFATATNRDKSKPCKINSIELGYFLGSRNGQITTVTAVPVWMITTGDGNKYFYDVRNGDLLM